MSYLLDTNVCIRYLNGQSDTIKTRLEQIDPSEVALCSIVKAELRFGATKSKPSTSNFARLERFFAAFCSYPFDDAAAEVYGQIRSDLEGRGTPIGSNDLLIAAIAMSRDLTLVTGNAREFRRVDGLRWQDWEAGRA